MIAASILASCCHFTLTRQGRLVSSLAPPGCTNPSVRSEILNKFHHFLFFRHWANQNQSFIADVFTFPQRSVATLLMSDAPVQC